MIIIVGLGNPDNEYFGTRHNIGYDIVEALCQKLDIDFFEKANTYRANRYLVTTHNEKDIVFCLPMGYMNNSGEAVRQILDFYRDQATKDVWVIHDDTDVPFGQVRIKFAGSSAGHNGVKSIDDTIGNKYWRIRVGVGRPANAARELSDFVLSKYTTKEKEELPEIIDQTVAYLLKSITDEIKSITFNAKEKTN